jgi:ABC-type sugar transport system ATPase subunit
MTMGDRIAVFAPLAQSINGNVMQCDTPLKLYREPANVFVAQFIGSPKMNILEMAVDTGKGNFVAGDRSISIPKKWRGAVSEHAKVLVGIRPEHLRIGHDDFQSEDTFAAEVDMVEVLGDEAVVHLTSANQSLTVRTGRREIVPSVGDVVRLRPEVDSVHVFDRETRQRLNASPSVESVSRDKMEKGGL